MNPTTRRRLFQVLLALAIIALVVIQGLLEVNPNH
jgi:cytochrome c-type biogenesis protein CcmE